MPDKASEEVDVSTSIQNKKPPGGDPGGRGVIMRSLWR